jgi:hypothetical protein
VQGERSGEHDADAGRRPGSTNVVEVTETTVDTDLIVESERRRAFSCEDGQRACVYAGSGSCVASSRGCAGCTVAVPRTNVPEVCGAVGRAEVDGESCLVAAEKEVRKPGTGC